MLQKWIWLCIGLAVVSIIVVVTQNKTHTSHATPPSTKEPSPFYSISIHSISGTPLDLAQFKNKVILIVNVASKCGFTYQYKDLEAIYNQFKSDDFIILGVPSNDFGGQEPGTSEDIQSFCQLNYGVTFPITEKVKILGEDQHKLYSFLTQSNPDYVGNVKWNFTKFLLDKEGHVVKRYSSMTNPSSKKIVSDIKHFTKQ